MSFQPVFFERQKAYFKSCIYPAPFPGLGFEFLVCLDLVNAPLFCLILLEFYTLKSLFGTDPGDNSDGSCPCKRLLPKKIISDF